MIILVAPKNDTNVNHPEGYCYTVCCPTYCTPTHAGSIGPIQD